jgi:cardiolipin synthase
MLRALPNLLSIGRLLATPFLGRWIWQREYEWALGLLVLAGLSDAFDGFLARRFNWKSRAGAYLDPLADKALLVTAYLVLAIDTVIPRWVGWLVVGRDVLILAMVAAGFAFTKIREFPPSLWGKVSTIAQIVFVILVLLNRSMIVPENGSGPIEKSVMWAVVALTALSGLDYLWRGLKMVRS